MSKRTISDLADSDGDSSAKRQSASFQIRPFNNKFNTTVPICTLKPIVAESSCQLQADTEKPMSPVWLDGEEFNMDFYPDNYPPSPISVDGQQYESDSDNGSEICDIRFGSDTGSVADGLVEITDDEQDLEVLNFDESHTRTFTLPPFGFFEDYSYRGITNFTQLGTCDLIQKLDLALFGNYITAQLFKQILESVQYLHTTPDPIIHRDLHSGNILLKFDKQNTSVVKIADLGIACVHKYKGRKHNEDRGYTTYEAEEVLNSSFYDIRPDISSLGKLFKKSLLFSLYNFPILSL